MEAIASRVEAIASRVEAIASRLENDSEFLLASPVQNQVWNAVD